MLPGLSRFGPCWSTSVALGRHSQNNNDVQLDRWTEADRIFHPHAGIAQLVEHNLAKVGVASSSLVSRSKFPTFQGWVAEWLCSGLQSRVRRFDSALSLHY